MLYWFLKNSLKCISSCKETKEKNRKKKTKCNQWITNLVQLYVDEYENWVGNSESGCKLLPCMPTDIQSTCARCSPLSFNLEHFLHKPSPPVPSIPILRGLVLSATLVYAWANLLSQHSLRHHLNNLIISLQLHKPRITLSSCSNSSLASSFECTLNIANA